MRLDANDPLLGPAMGLFKSAFPSDDALFQSPKFAALMKAVDPSSPTAATEGSRIIARAQAEAWRAAQAACNRAKATVVGDLPSAWLPEVAFFRQVRPGVEALGGLFAQVAFPQSSDPAAFVLALAEVGLDAALNFMSAAPIVGPLMKWILNLGNFLGRLFASAQVPEAKAVLLPWADYTRDSDEDIVQKFLIDKYFANVDWTGIFLPPYETVPWHVAQGVKNGHKLGAVWAPTKGGQVAYSSQGLGAMPGTFRIAGHVQSPELPQADPRLLRYFSDGTMMHWGRTLTDCGEFYPATAQTATLAWQQAQRDGSPDMFKVDCAALETAWVAYFDQFFDSLWREYTDNDEWAGEFAAPYLAVQASTLRLGLRDPSRPSSPQLQRPHPAPLITPGIFKAGAGTPATRNSCLYLEHVDGPYGKGQGRDGKAGNKTSSGGGLAFPYKRDAKGRIVASGGPVPGPHPRGSVCVPWPSGEELLVTYQRPDTALILPAVRRLAERQRWSLKHTLVSAYVRVDGPGAYAAFKASPALAQLARDMRTKLLQHDARFQVRLADVHDIDPGFEQLLRNAGVTNSPAQLAGQLGLKAAAEAEAADDAAKDPPPPALPPQGGIPFDVEPPARPRGGTGAAGLAAGLAGAAALLYRLRS